MINYKHLSIIIPCFNEAQNVSILLRNLEKLITSRSEEIEVIVIDGASTDTTPQELQKVFKNLPANSFKLILQNQKGGYGSDIMQALATAEGEVLAWTHADLQTDPRDVLAAYDKYQQCSSPEKEVLIKGHRKQRRFLEAFFSLGMELFAFIFLRVYLREINAQPKMFSRNFYETYLLKDHPKDFSLDLYALFLARRYGSTIHSIPVYFKDRIYGEAKGGGGSWRIRLKLIKRTANYIMHLRRFVDRP